MCIDEWVPLWKYFRAILHPLAAPTPPSELPMAQHWPSAASNLKQAF